MHVTHAPSLSAACFAVALTGVRAGVPLIVAYTLLSMWTIHLLNALYLEYKRTKVRGHGRLHGLRQAACGRRWAASGR